MYDMKMVRKIKKDKANCVRVLVRQTHGAGGYHVHHPALILYGYDLKMPPTKADSML